jgi:hypothetical protein
MPGVRRGLERASGWSWTLGSMLEDVVARCDCCGRANDRSGDGERGRRRAGLAPGESQVQVEGVAGWRASGRDGERREREVEVVQNGGCDIGFGDEGKDGRGHAVTLGPQTRRTHHGIPRGFSCKSECRPVEPSRERHRGRQARSVCGRRYGYDVGAPAVSGGVSTPWKRAV